MMDELMAGGQASAHRELAAGAGARILPAARAALDANWAGSSTVPSRQLYPHQWSWDSAFISIGRSWYDEARAQRELLTLFDAQWANGKLPHIVFNPAIRDADYFPGPAFWQSERSAAAPRGIATSGITQPPLHARAALEMHRHTKRPAGSRAFLRALYPKLVAQHAFLDRERDPLRLGLPVIVHPWESGLDNSPVWDRDLADLTIPAGSLPPYVRHDTTRVQPADRPTDQAYDAFVYLAMRYRDTGYDDRAAFEQVPFAICGPLFAAIYVWSLHAAADIASEIGVDPRPHLEAAERVHQALLDQLWDADARRFYPRDARSNHLEPEATIVSFGPLLDPALPTEMVDAICADLESACFHPAAPDHFVVPTSDLESADFDRGRYWRGPIWLNTNWLLWSGLRQHGRHELAAEIATSSLDLVDRSGFREYFDPFDGTGHGSPDFSWTAALAIDLIKRSGDGRDA
jgi:hypothetical protein